MASKLKTQEVILQSPNGLVEKTVTVGNDGVVTIGGNNVVFTEGVGVGQTWQDVFSSRANNTTYTNNTGRTIIVMVTSVYYADSNSRSYKSYINGNIVSNVTMQSNITGVFGFPTTLVVPNGQTYRIEHHSAPIQWLELR